MSRLDAVRAPIRAGWWRRLAARATDVTDRHDDRRTLVIAAHPDDESIGTGAAIARRAATGTPVDVVVLSDGASLTSPVLAPGELATIRAREVAAAAAILGVHDLHHLGFPDGRLAEHEAELVARVSELVASTRPDEILVTSGRDWHPDHRTASRVARVVAERAAVALAEYPIWFRADGPWDPTASRGVVARAGALLAEPVRARRGLRVEAIDTGPFLSAKNSAMQAHLSQFSGIPGDPDWVTLDDDWRTLFLAPRELFFRIRG